MSAPRYVFLTGGTGFIGSRVTRLLLDLRAGGAWDEVRVLARSDRSAEKAREIGATPVAGDLLDEGGAWREVVRRAAFVVHCAQPSTREGDYGVRARQEANLLGAIEDRATERAVFVYGSSFLGASEGPELIDETVEPRPVGLGTYFQSSIEALEARGRGGLDCVVAMPGAVYGRRTWFLEMALDALAVGARGLDGGAGDGALGVEGGSGGGLLCAGSTRRGRGEAASLLLLLKPSVMW